MTFFRMLLCGNNDAIDERASSRPGCFGNKNYVVEYYDENEQFSNPDQDDESKSFRIYHQQQPKKPNHDPAVLDKLIDIIEASETANETENEDDEDDEEFWDVSSLLGESLMTNYSPEPVSTRDALHGKTVVLLYFGAATGGDKIINKNNNDQSTALDRLKLFDAGYHHSVLSIVYCHDDTSAFVDMPARWYAAQNAAELAVSLDVATTARCSSNSGEPSLMVIDPVTGDVLSENAFPDIMQLDVSKTAAVYDEQATKLFQSWTRHMPVEQSVIGEMIIDLPPNLLIADQEQQEQRIETSSVNLVTKSRAVIV